MASAAAPGAFFADFVHCRRSFGQRQCGFLVGAHRISDIALSAEQFPEIGIVIIGVEEYDFRFAKAVVFDFVDDLIAFTLLPNAGLLTGPLIERQTVIQHKHIAVTTPHIAYHTTIRAEQYYNVGGVDL